MPCAEYEYCIACETPIKEGELYLPDASGGFLHRACIGPERECFTRNGEPLKDGDPVPEGYVWTYDDLGKPRA